MLYIRPISTSDTCHIKAVTLGNEFPLTRTQSSIRHTSGRKAFVLSSAAVPLLQLLHYRSKYERTKIISHSLPIRRVLSVLPVVQRTVCIPPQLMTGPLRLIFRRLQIVDAPRRRRPSDDFRTTAYCTTDACPFCLYLESAARIDRTSALDRDSYARITLQLRVRAEQTSPQVCAG